MYYVNRKPRRENSSYRARMGDSGAPDTGLSQSETRSAWQPPAQTRLHPRTFRGYPWFSFSRPRHWGRLAVTIGMISLGVITYVWYLQTGLPTVPTSLPGLAYALAGTVCFLCALCLYWLQRRLRLNYRFGLLHRRLKWHYSYALIGTVLLAFHSFGYMDSHLSGTYALLSLLMLVISGYIGRFLDRLLPRLSAVEVCRMLTEGAAPSTGSLPSRTTTNLALPPGPIRLPSPALPDAQTSAARKVALYRSLRVIWKRCHIILAGLACVMTAWHLGFVIWLFLTRQLTIP